MERNFIPVTISLLTISDTRSKEDDKSGNLLENKVLESGHILFDRKIVRDDISEIKKTSKDWIENPDVEIIISTGGTGLTGRDVSPEAFRQIFDKEIEGFGELFRYLSFKKIGTSTIQSRAIAGVSNGTYIFVLPGSPSACKDAWDDILSHQFDYRHTPCNFVEIMPRLLENNRGRSGKK
ncbi:MAG: molybdenum cofactor biosynthesis protein B [Rickettsiales bacterium]|nr:molybdenum cofactor biosynthesis protein B [Rickettsiales bacterium]|tara:strand:+ start:53 stop:592 length:540 start_codon:yes stop_codon:yes gene_type:complete